MAFAKLSRPLTSDLAVIDVYTSISTSISGSIASDIGV